MPAPPVPGVSSLSLLLFLDGPVGSGFVPEESKRVGSLRLGSLATLLITNGTHSLDAKSLFKAYPQTALPSTKEMPKVQVATTAMLWQFVFLKY